MGLCSMSARVAGILAPLVRLLAHYHRAIPMAIFGSTPVLGGLLCVLLPETRGTDLPDDTGDGRPPPEVGHSLGLPQVGIWEYPLAFRVLGVSLGVTEEGGRGVELSHCGGRGGYPIILFVELIPSFLSMGWNSQCSAFLPLPSSGKYWCLILSWLLPSRSSQPSFLMGPGGIAPQYFCCLTGRRVSTGAVGNGIQVAEGCLSQGQLIAHLSWLLHPFPSHQVYENATSGSQNGQVKGKDDGQDSESTKTTYF